MRWVIAAILALTSCQSTTQPPTSPVPTRHHPQTKPIASCRTTRLKLDYEGWQGSSQTLFGYLRIRDASASPCRLSGHVYVSGVDTHDHRVTDAVTFRITRPVLLTPKAKGTTPESPPPKGVRMAGLTIYGPEFGPTGRCSRSVRPAAFRVAVAGKVLHARNRGVRGRAFATCHGKVSGLGRVHLVPR
jgi:hypothetical protein